MIRPQRPALLAALALMLAVPLVTTARPCAAAGEQPPAAAPASLGPEAGPAADSIVAMLRRIHVYFRLHEAEGITMDSRYPINPSEAIRMGVVCQLLGYTELAKMRPRRMFQREIRNHAAFLVSRLDTVRSHSPFDGMLGYALLQAYEQTRDSSFLAAGRIVVEEMKAIPTYQCVLNGGLMVAMATANWAVLTGDPVAAQKTYDIVGGLAPYQNADGSFPHWCYGSEDIHYTGWMGEELVLIERMTRDARIPPMLGRMRDFIETRIGPDGQSSYTGPCTVGPPGCVRYYDSQHSGCAIDYDTRAWTVEPAYSVQLLDMFHSPTVSPLMQFLQSMESGGTWSDKYDYIPPPNDPEYPWSIADTSVANTSINFWILATALVNRVLRGQIDPAAVALDDGGSASAARVAGLPPGTPRGRGPRWRTVDSLFVAGASPMSCAAAGGNPRAPAPSPPLRPRPGEVRAWIAAPHPNPAAGPSFVRFGLREPAAVTLVVYDTAGRRVRDLVTSALVAGEHAVAWDGCDDAGRPCGSGVYFARLVADGEAHEVRMVRLH